MTTVSSKLNPRTLSRPIQCFENLNERADVAGAKLGSRVQDKMITTALRSHLPAMRAGAAANELSASLGVSAQRSASRALQRGLDGVAAAERAKKIKEALQPEPKVHVVVPGDTLSAIAASNGVTLPELLAVNPQIENPDVIHVGETINLPASASEAPANEVPASDGPADATSATPSSDALPSSTAEADAFHITQFVDPKYNPTGPSFSSNCGPASLAMTLDTLGKLPPGLTPEQSVDYARALMRPDLQPTSYVTASDGQRVPQLNIDGEYSNTGQIETATRSLGIPSENQSGWDALDASLAAGKPVIANGTINDHWRSQFPQGQGRYGSGDVDHFNTILGKTPDGKYIVSDPMFTGGPVEMTREQLAVFFGPNYGGVPSFMALG